MFKYLGIFINLASLIPCLGQCIAASPTFTPSLTDVVSMSAMVPTRTSTTQASTLIAVSPSESSPAPTAAESQPSQGVFIAFGFHVAADGEFVTAGGQWNFFEHNINETIAYEICNWTAVSYTIASGFTGLGNVAWPPDLDIGDRSIWGYSGCEYRANGNMPGTLECDNTSQVRCEKDPGWSMQLACSENNSYMSVTFVPRIRCWLSA